MSYLQCCSNYYGDFQPAICQPAWYAKTPSVARLASSNQGVVVFLIIDANTVQNRSAVSLDGQHVSILCIGASSCSNRARDAGSIENIPKELVYLERNLNHDDRI